ncbi:hypothetical protein DFH27DRAFT_263972 [Peziza echinospora]|nr:hypothetical protein DFH27DRAFT_263972 [Peziza echinospora]
MSESLPTLPSTAAALVNAYKQLAPILIPTTFAYPLVEEFAAAHDPLLVDHGEKLLTASIVLREAGVQMDTITRSMERAAAASSVTANQAPTTSSSIPDTPAISLAEIKKARLRARLQSQSQPSLAAARQALIRDTQHRKAEFDRQMEREEEEAVNAFKKGLRDAVVLTSGRV